MTYVNKGVLYESSFQFLSLCLSGLPLFDSVPGGRNQKTSGLTPQPLTNTHKHIYLTLCTRFLAVKNKTYTLGIPNLLEVVCCFLSVPSEI